jgi:2-hydroxy-6-oxonona-2,4-dienedioate hydrolase
MDATLDAPSSCKTCAFLPKCFGGGDTSPIERTTVLPNAWSTYPLQLRTETTRVLSTGVKGPPIVFIHGPAGSADRWAFNLHSFARAGYRALAFDLPGHGHASKTPNSPVSISQNAAVLGDFLDRLPEPAILVGASTGAHIAAHYAGNRPGRIKALVLVSGGGAIPLEVDQRERLRLLTVYRSREGARERLRRSVFDARLAAGDIVELEHRMNSSPGARDYLGTLGRYIADDIDHTLTGAKLQEIARTMPVLVVWGDEDKILPVSFGRESQIFIGGLSRFLSIEQAAHLPYFERPGTFNQALLSFLRDNADRGDKRDE